jgi:hypothetical protein
MHRWDGIQDLLTGPNERAELGRLNGSTVTCITANLGYEWNMNVCASERMPRSSCHPSWTSANILKVVTGDEKEMHTYTNCFDFGSETLWAAGMETTHIACSDCERYGAIFWVVEVPYRAEKPKPYVIDDGLHQWRWSLWGSGVALASSPALRNLENYVQTWVKL